MVCKQHGAIISAGKGGMPCPVQYASVRKSKNAVAENPNYWICSNFWKQINMMHTYETYITLLLFHLTGRKCSVRNSSITSFSEFFFMVQVLCPEANRNLSVFYASFPLEHRHMEKLNCEQHKSSALPGSTVSVVYFLAPLSLPSL